MSSAITTLVEQLLLISEFENWKLIWYFFLQSESYSICIAKTRQVKKLYNKKLLRQENFLNACTASANWFDKIMTCHKMLPC